MAESYGAKDLEVLEGLEPVRERPGMYIGTTGSKGMHHILWEIVDNSIDEVTNGYGDSIDIEIFEDNSISVQDNGRGIPVDIHPKYKVPGVYLVFTKLHAGGKFNNKNYSFSGGLHGVGASVTNALSAWTKVQIWRDGMEYEVEFYSPEVNGKVKSGIIKKELTSKPCADKKKKGTKVTFLPDERVFKQEKFDFEIIRKRIKDLAFLNAGMKISVTDHRQLTESGKPKTKSYCYKGGLSDFVQYLNEGKTVLYQTPITLEKKQNNFYVSLSMQLTDTYSENIYSYVNNIPTTEGGTHEVGFKSALTKALNDFGRQKNLIKEKQENYLGEDFREGLTAVLSIKMQNVQFEGQTKTKLGNPEARTVVEGLLTDAIKDYLNNKAKKDVIDAIFNKAALAMKARTKSAEAKNIARAIKSNGTSSLVGKLSGCSGKKPELNELFIVEGDSAGGSAKLGRDPKTQAILPLKGKPLNVEKCRVADIVKNDELISLINALGAGFDKDFNIKNLKYHKIIILADADEDGGHIRSILLTFFFRYMKELITNGNLFVGMPPLYRITDKNGVRYAYDNVELQKLLETAAKGYKLNRYKGLGEMNPSQLWETTMDPKRRALMKVTIEDAAEADHLITTLMGEEVGPRKEYIYEYANFNKQDEFKEIVNKG